MQVLGGGELQTMAAPEQAPATEHESPWVQRLPSSQSEPPGLSG